MKKQSYRYTSLVVLAAAALIPALAAAQSGPSYVVSPPVPMPYVSLSSGTQLTVSDSTGQAVNLPFSVPFFGQPQSTLGVSMNGYVIFSAQQLGENANRGIPHNSSSNPTNLIAVWWDDLDNASSGSKVWYQIRGTAPNRTVVVEWKDVVRWNTSGKFSFQLELSETTGRIRMFYGPNTPSTADASVGIQGEPGIGLAGLSCTTSSSGTCSPSNFPVGQMIEFRPPADLQIPAYGPDLTVYGGVPFTARVELENTGGIDGTNVKVRQYLSTDPQLDPAVDLPVGELTVPTLASFSKQTIVVPGTVPSSVTPGDYFLIALADPDGVILESNEANNKSTPVSVTVGEPTPDLIVESVNGPGTVSAGATLTLNGQVRNRGNADITADVPVTIYLSDNPVVSQSDKALGTVTVTAPLAAGQTQAINGGFTVPDTLPGGKYWIGACADMEGDQGPSGALEEIDETNNCVVGGSLLLNAGPLMVATTSLMEAVQNAPYGERLEAVGGTGQYSWSVNSGELPGGLTLTSDGGIVGTPFAAGSYTFEAQVTSGTGSGAATATRSFTINVQAKDRPLDVVSQTLPAGEFGRGYEHQLVASGGVPPYRWQLGASSKLPRGLALSADGYLTGRPFELASPATFDVVVTDSTGQQASRTLSLVVVAPSTLRVATGELAKGMLGRTYRQPLQAVGGSGDYTFTVVGFQRLARAYGETNGELLPSIPDGFGLAVVNNELKGTPNQAGLFAITLHVQDNASTEVEDLTTLPLLISYSDGLQLITQQLPEARVGEAYQVKLLTNVELDEREKTEKTAVTYSEPCLQQPTAGATGITFNCVRDPAQTLPAGLQLSPDGTLSGTPEPLADGAQTKTFDFLVMVSDNTGRSDVRSLSLKVRAPPPPKEGCTAVGGEALPLLGGALVLLSGLRRRRR